MYLDIDDMMRNYPIERIKGRKFDTKKFAALKYKELRKMWLWLADTLYSKKGSDFQQICKEVSDLDLARYRMHGLGYLPEVKAYRVKRKAMRALWNETFPESIKKGSKTKSK